MRIHAITNHCNEITNIGEGSYGKVYKLCLKNQSLVHRINCSFCRKYHRKEIVAKEVITREYYDEKEINSEYEIHKTCYSGNPNFFIKIYDFWIEETKRSLINDFLRPQKVGIFILEYMNQRNLREYFTAYSEGVITHKLNISSVIFIIIYLIHYLHNELNICHGDISVHNIFINYIGENYVNQLVEFDGKQYKIPTNGFEIKLGDFSVAEYMKPHNRSTFIKRDYIGLCNIYGLRNRWINFTNYNTYSELIKFIDSTINYYFSEDLLFHSNNKKFWNNTSLYIDEKVLYYSFPKKLLERYIRLFIQD